MDEEIIDGVTKFVNSKIVIELAEEAGLHGFFGVIVVCLSGVPTSIDMAIAEHAEMARQLKRRGIVPQDCHVRYIGPWLKYHGVAGLAVNYKEL